MHVTYINVYNLDPIDWEDSKGFVMIALNLIG